MTPGFRLAARHVIHAVGPIWSGGGRGEDDLLSSCYTRSLELAGNADLATIAFSCTATGVFGFPKERAARIAFDTVSSQAPRHVSLERIVFCCLQRVGRGDLSEGRGGESRVRGTIGSTWTP